MVYTISVPRRTKLVTIWLCNVCGHEWQSEAGKPLRCAGCKSPYWDRPKTRQPSRRTKTTSKQ